MQTIIELLTKRRVDSILKDVERGDTCVLMKPKGVKLMITTPPKFNVGDKTSRTINTLDLLMSDLYINPYMHFHKIKSKLLSSETYEVVHYYDDGNLYLTSIKDRDGFVNDYKVMAHRADLYDISMPTVPGLNMDALTSLIVAPEINFTKLRLNHKAAAVMFLNHEYQAILDNPHKEKSLPASEAYTKLVNVVFEHRPETLHQGINDRFIDIFEWAERVKKNYQRVTIKDLKLPKHTLEIQDFTMTFLPLELYDFMKKSRLNVAIVRTILTILGGKGYKEGVHVDVAASQAVKAMAHGLNWEI